MICKVSRKTICDYFFQTQQDIEQALSEDPNIFDYDGVYDSMMEEKRAKDVRLLSKKDSRVGTPIRNVTIHCLLRYYFNTPAVSKVSNVFLIRQRKPKTLNQSEHITS